MSARSELLRAMASAHAQGNRAIPYGPELRNAPALAELEEPARALARLAFYADAHPDDPVSREIRENYDLLAKLLAAPRLR
jgi:hypothetical protein